MIGKRKQKQEVGALQKKFAFGQTKLNFGSSKDKESTKDDKETSHKRELKKTGSPAGTIWGKPELDDKSTLSIYSWNVNGINSTIKSKKLQEFIDAAKPDVLCLNETKIDPAKINSQGVWKEIPEGYEQHYNCCKIKNGY